MVGHVTIDMGNVGPVHSFVDLEKKENTWENDYV